MKGCTKECSVQHSDQIGRGDLSTIVAKTPRKVMMSRKEDDREKRRRESMCAQRPQPHIASMSLNSNASCLVQTFRHSDMQIAQRPQTTSTSNKTRTPRIPTITWHMDGSQGSGTTLFPELHCALNEKEKQMMLHINTHFFLH